MQLYRHLFQPSETLQKPYAMIGVPIIAADTDEHARYLATTAQQRALARVRGKRVPLQPPVADMSSLWSPQEHAAVDQRLGAAIIGGPQTVAQKLQELINTTSADEVMIVSDIYEHAERVHSYRTVAAARQLTNVA